MVVGIIRFGGFQSNGSRYADGNVVADPVELEQNVLLDGGGDVARLKPDSVDEELLLYGTQGVVEQTGLGPVIAKGRGATADEVA